MTTLLLVALRGIKTELGRDAVTSLCLFFNAIEQKVIDEEKLLDLEMRHFETLCLLEATFPPSFFDLMLHLTAHLVREIWFLGPSYLHQMFPYERFYGFLKSLVHNRLFPEGAIVCGYETIQAVEWAMGYMDPQNPIGVPRSWHEGRLSGVGTMGKSVNTKIWYRRSLICGSNSVKKSVRKKEGFFKKIRQRSPRSAICFRSARKLFALILRDCMMTWPKRKGRMDG
jgi:hypothetical protein